MSTIQNNRLALAALPSLNTQDAAPGAWVRLRGTIAARTPAPFEAGWVRLSTPNPPPQLARIRPNLTLLLDSGEEVLVHLSTETRFAPVHERRGAWGELEQTEAGQCFAKRGPGPHVRVTLESALLKAGDTIEVLGRVKAQGPAAGGGPRVSPGLRPTQLEAALVAGGEDPARALETLFHQRPSRSAGELLRAHWGKLALLLLLVFSAWIFSRIVVRPWALLGLAAMLVALLHAYWTVAGPALPPFYLAPREAGSSSRSPEKGGGEAAELIGYLILGLSTLLATFPHVIILLISALSDDALPTGTLRAKNDPRTFHSIAYWLALVASFTVPVFSLWRWLSWRRLAALLWSAPPLQGDGWGGVVGVIQDDTPVEVSGRAVALYHHTRSNGKKQPTTQEQHFRGSFQLESEQGDFEIEPAHLIWASEEKVPNSTGAELPVGATALVVGRPDRGRFAATGDESLLLFAGPGDPRAVLRARSRDFVLKQLLPPFLGALLYFLHSQLALP